MAEWADFTERIQLANQAKLGVDATYTPFGGAPVAIRGPFSAAAARVEFAGDVAVESRRPILSVHLADLAAKPARGDAVTVRGVDYLVREVQEDGEGDANLILGVA